jgi:hypothetical protein
VGAPRSTRSLACVVALGVGAEQSAGRSHVGGTPTDQIRCSRKARWRVHACGKFTQWRCGDLDIIDAPIACLDSIPCASRMSKRMRHCAAAVGHRCESDDGDIFPLSSRTPAAIAVWSRARRKKLEVVEFKISLAIARSPCCSGLATRWEGHWSVGRDVDRVVQGGPPDSMTTKTCRPVAGGAVRSPRSDVVRQRGRSTSDRAASCRASSIATLKT